jgi:exopolyphosphatase / guanosine-5'-triphosphate,3'-diphosphate pyrophosphatase
VDSLRRITEALERWGREADGNSPARADALPWGPVGANGLGTDDGARVLDRAGSRIAVIDLGTNSTRLMIADVSDGEVHERERDTQVTRLGRGVDLSRRLSANGVEAVCATVADYLATAHAHEPDRTVAIATSAVRDADNGEVFLAELRERFDLAPRVIDGDTEARLTYRGATAGREADGECILVCDIGGGSTELVIGCDEDVLFSASMQTGVVRQSERHISRDPPDQRELEALAGEVRSTLVETIAAKSPPSPDRGIAVAGTPTSLAAIELELDPYDPAQVHGHRLSMRSAQTMLSRLATMPLHERFRVTGLQPGRAPTIVAGVVILIQVMRAFGLSEIEVSEHDILYGIALEAAANGAPA